MNSLVSVIIPTYNRGKFIIQALESVITQSYKDIEIIIIDDGSTDNTKDIVSNYILNKKNINIKYFYKENSGVANARNYGIQISQGTYIAFLDSDDLWKENKIEKQIKIFNNNINIGLVHSCYTVLIDEQQITRYPDNADDYQGNVFEKMIQFNMVVTSTVILRKECINKIGLFEQEYSPSEDYDLWLRISENYEFRYINESLAFYRESSSDNISKNLKKLEDGTIKILDKNWNKVNNLNLLKLKNQSYSRFYSYISTFYYQQNNNDKFIEYYIKAINLDINNYISLPESSKAIKLLIKRLNGNSKFISYTYLRLARQNFFEKKILEMIISSSMSILYSPIMFLKYFIIGFLVSFLKKRVIKI